MVNRAQRARSIAERMFLDDMTGLLNQQNLLAELQRSISTCQRDFSDISFCIIDLDSFKEINDTHGHLIGDQVIKKLASLLKKRLRKTDVIGRYGGDEFAIILPNTDLDHAVGLLEEVRQEFATTRFASSSGSFSTSMSIGVTELVTLDLIPADVINRADGALYQSKANGHNRVKAAKV